MSSHRQAGGREVTARVSAPAFYGPQRKYGPVVAPKPKVNPYRAASRPDPGPVESRPDPGPSESRPDPGPVESRPDLGPAESRPDPGPSASRPDPGPAETRPQPAFTVIPASGSRSHLGRVGEIPESVSADDLPPPPPPADDAEAWLGPGYLSAPPPPPPPPFEDSFPPPPADEQFPTPPSPLMEERTLTAGTEMPTRDENTLEAEINSLTTLLKDMENGDSPRQVTGSPSQSCGQGEFYSAPPDPPPAKFGPKATGFSPAKAPKPQFIVPNAQPTKARPSLQDESRGQDLGTREPPVDKGGRSPNAQAENRPRSQQRPTASQSGLSGGPSDRDVRPSGGDTAPMSYKDVQELEKLARTFMEEMDKIPEDRSTGEHCGQCGKEVLRSQPAVKALDRVFHAACFVCSSCREPLQGQQFYEVNGTPLCLACHLDTLEKCAVCGRPIAERMLRATGRAFHPECFCCTSCCQSLEGQAFIAAPNGDVLCVPDYHRRFSPRCCVCEEPIVPEEGKKETVRILALDKNFHVCCYRCEDCGTQLSTEANEKGCYPLDGHILCLDCHSSRVSKSPRP